MMMMLLNHVDEKANKGEECNNAGNENKEGGGANKEASGVSNPDEAQMNNIDLGGVLNLAAEDTLNIRLEPPSEIFHSFSQLSREIFFSGSSCGTFTICGAFP